MIDSAPFHIRKDAVVPSLLFSGLHDGLCFVILSLSVELDCSYSTIIVSHFRYGHLSWKCFLCFLLFFPLLDGILHFDLSLSNVHIYTLLKNKHMIHCFASSFVAWVRFQEHCHLRQLPSFCLKRWYRSGNLSQSIVGCTWLG